MADQLDPCAFRPRLQLICRSSAERIACSYDYVLSGTAKRMRDLADRGRFSNTVDTDHKKNGQGAFKAKGLALSDHIGKDLLQALLHLSGLFNTTLLDLVAELINDLLGRNNTHVRADQHFLQLLQKILIHTAHSLEHAEKRCFGLRKTLLQFIKE